MITVSEEDFTQILIPKLQQDLRGQDHTRLLLIFFSMSNYFSSLDQRTASRTSFLVLLCYQHQTASFIYRQNFSDEHFFKFGVPMLYLVPFL